MNKTEYEVQRKSLYDEAKNLLLKGNVKDAEQKKQEIKALDEQFELDAKQTANLMAELGNKSAKTLDNIRNGDVRMNNTETGLNSLEYRKAFMDYVQRGTVSDLLRNQDATTTTSTAGAVIPTVVLDRIVAKLEAESVMYDLVTKTNYKGGLSIPTVSVKPAATWVNENAGSDKKAITTGSITFAYHKLRIAVAASLEVETMSLPAFETFVVNLIGTAMANAIDDAIINGDGTSQPLGILNNASGKQAVVSGQMLTVAKGAGLDYDVLVNAEAALPSQYESGAVWIMSKKTFMSFVGMTDDDGQPIGRVNYGLGGKPERFLLGREVRISDKVSDFAASPSADTTFACIVNPKDYILNINLNLTVKEYEDNDTDSTVRKAIMLVDGKLVDNGSLVVLKVSGT